MIELWKYIDGFNNRYMISSKGRVLSLSTKDPTIKKPSKDKFGYVRYSITKEYQGKPSNLYAHVLVAKAFIKNNDPNKTQVNHKNSIPNDNSIENLEWVTPKDNVHHAIKRSLDNNGGHWKGKISKSDAEFIRSKFKNPYKAVELGEMFSLDLSTVYSIIRKETWVV